MNLNLKKLYLNHAIVVVKGYMCPYLVVGLWCVIVACPGHTELFILRQREKDMLTNKPTEP